MGMKSVLQLESSGLDYFRLEGSEEEILANKTEQKRVLSCTDRVSKKSIKKPLNSSCKEMLLVTTKELMLEANVGEVGGVLHCFNGR